MYDAADADQYAWTPDCIDPAVMPDLVESGRSHPDAEALFAHLQQCDYCMEEYRDVCEALNLRNRALELLGRGDPAQQTLDGPGA